MEPTKIISDISIHYINATNQTDFEVVVFTKNYNINTPEVYYVAWQVLRGQTEVDFMYKVEMEIGATYESRGKKIIAGPFGAELGSSWDITQPKLEDTATLKQTVGLPPNPNGSIVVKNVKPPTWSGRMFDVGIYKSGNLLVTQKGVHVGDQVDFELKPKLFFGVVRNMHVGDIFTSLEITSALTEFDLSEHPNGLKVTLNEGADGGEYSFSGTSMV